MLIRTRNVIKNINEEAVFDFMETDWYGENNSSKKG